MNIFRLNMFISSTFWCVLTGLVSLVFWLFSWLFEFATNATDRLKRQLRNNLLRINLLITP